MSKKISPWRFPVEMARMERDMERMFEEGMGGDLRGRWPAPFWQWAAPRAREWALSPWVDVYEEGNDVVVKAEVPGLSREDIELSVSGDVLTIKGAKKKEEKIEEKDYFFSERVEGAFSRTVELPEKVLSDKVSASLKNGILEIRLPKADGAGKKEIKIKVE